jgi:hypothetical protein
MKLTSLYRIKSKMKIQVFIEIGLSKPVQFIYLLSSHYSYDVRGTIYIISNIHIGSPMSKCDLIQFQQIVCFLSTAPWRGDIENAQQVGYKSHKTKSHWRFFLSHIINYYLFFIYTELTFSISRSRHYYGFIQIKLS